MNKYIGVIFKSKKNMEEEETFIISQDLIKRGILGNLFVKIEGAFIEITNEITVLEWIKQSDDKKLYCFEEGEFKKIDLNDIPFEDYIKIYNSKENKIGQFVIEKYLTFKNEKCTLFLSMKTDSFENKIFCEYYNKTTQEFIYTERVLGLDKIITDNNLKENIKTYFEKYKKENL